MRWHLSSIVHRHTEPILQHAYLPPSSHLRMHRKQIRWRDCRRVVGRLWLLLYERLPGGWSLVGLERLQMHCLND